MFMGGLRMKLSVQFSSFSKMSSMTSGASNDTTGFFNQLLFDICQYPRMGVSGISHAWEFRITRMGRKTTTRDLHRRSQQ